MGGSSKMPAPPSAGSLIKGQTKANTEAANQSFKLSAPNQQGPTGSYTWAKGPDGRWTVTNALNAQEQGIYDVGAQGRNLAGTTGLAGLGAAAPMLSTPLDLSDPNIGSEITSKLRPQFEAEQARMRQARTTELVNKGLTEGSTGFVNAMRDFDANQNDAWNRYAGNSRQQIIDEMLTQRAQPVAEFANLQSLSPVAWPKQMTTPQIGVNPVNTAAITQNEYDQRLQLAMQEQQRKDAMMSGLFQLGGTVIGGIAGGPIGAGIGGSLGGALGGGGLSGMGGWVGPGGSGPGLGGQFYPGY